MAQAVKVGIFAFVGLLILAWFILKIEDIELFQPEGRRLTAEFDSVAGLDDRAAVRVAGVRVGRVDGIELAGRKARVGLLLEQPVELPEGSFARLASTGLLGDRFVEVVPGPPGGAPLAEGAVIPGETPVTLDEAMAKLGQVGDSIQEITSSVSGGLGPQGNITELIDTFTATAEEIRQLVAANRQQVSATVGNLARASDTLAAELPQLASRMERVLDQISVILEENRPELAGSMENIRSITERLQTSVENINQITGKIAGGEGTIGKLVNSDEAHAGLVSTLDSIKGGVEDLTETLGQVRRLKVDLGLQTYYLQDVEEYQNSFRFDITPGQGKRRYRLGLVDDPRGKEKNRFERITVTRPDGTVETTTIDTFKRDDDPTYTALFGFEATRDLVVWGGLIENSGGVQLDYPLLGRKLWLSLEAFDFDRASDLNPHLRLTGEWRFHKNFFLMGGYDDFLEGSRDSLFLGGGVRWTDDTAKLLLTSAPGL